MAVTVSKYNKFIEHVGKNNIDLTQDTFKVVLVNNYTFSGAHEVATDLGATEIGNTNGYTTGGETIDNLTLTWTGSTTRWDGDDVSWTASGGSIGPCDGAVIIDTTADKLVCYIDFGQEESAGDGTDFKITFNTAGILTIT